MMNYVFSTLPTKLLYTLLFILTYYFLNLECLVPGDLVGNSYLFFNIQLKCHYLQEVSSVISGVAGTRQILQSFF